MTLPKAAEGCVPWTLRGQKSSCNLRIDVGGEAVHETFGLPIKSNLSLLPIILRTTTEKAERHIQSRKAFCYCGIARATSRSLKTSCFCGRTTPVMSIDSHRTSPGTTPAGVLPVRLTMSLKERRGGFCCKIYGEVGILVLYELKQCRDMFFNTTAKQYPVPLRTISE